MITSSPLPPSPMPDRCGDTAVPSAPPPVPAAGGKSRKATWLGQRQPHEGTAFNPYTVVFIDVKVILKNTARKHKGKIHNGPTSATQ